MVKDFQRDDIIFAISPTSPGSYVCKRVRFLEGDEILVPGFFGEKRVIIPKGYLWIEGDNAEKSFDSRNYGPIPKQLVKGKVLCRIYPPSLLNTPIPETNTIKIN
eukprot:gene3162-3960_t